MKVAAAVVRASFRGFTKRTAYLKLAWLPASGIHVETSLLVKKNCPLHHSCRQIALVKKISRFLFEAVVE